MNMKFKLGVRERKEEKGKMRLRKRRKKEKKEFHCVGRGLRSRERILKLVRRRRNVDK